MKRLSAKLANTIKEYTSILDELNIYKDSVKALSEKLAFQENILLQNIEEGDHVPTDDGRTMTIATRRVYGDWPEDIVTKETELKELKAQAKRVGNLNYEIKKSITVK